MPDELKFNSDGLDTVASDDYKKPPINLEVYTPFGLFKPLQDRLKMLTPPDDLNKEDQIDAG